jgi:hypothetical protein
MVPIDLGMSGTSVPGRKRQTNKRWRDRYGERGSAALWGLHLGLGVLTIRTTSLFWIALIAVASSGSLAVGLTFAAYGLGLGLNLVVGGLRLEGGDFGRPIAALRLMPYVSRASALTLTLCGMFLLASGIVSSFA